MSAQCNILKSTSTSRQTLTINIAAGSIRGDRTAGEGGNVKGGGEGSEKDRAGNHCVLHGGRIRRVREKDSNERTGND